MSAPYVSADHPASVSITQGESGATVFAFCHWTDDHSELMVIANWYPNTTTQLVHLIRSQLQTTIAGLGLVAGFKQDGHLSVLTTDGLILDVSGNPLAAAGAIEITSALIDTGTLDD